MVIRPGGKITGGVVGGWSVAVAVAAVFEGVAFGVEMVFVSEMGEAPFAVAILDGTLFALFCDIELGLTSLVTAGGGRMGNDVALFVPDSVMIALFNTVYALAVCAEEGPAIAAELAPRVLPAATGELSKMDPAFADADSAVGDGAGGCELTAIVVKADRAFSEPDDGAIAVL